MSGRIAHRPHYRMAQPSAHFSLSAHKRFLSAKWTFRQQTIQFEKHHLGYELAHIPLRHRLMQHLVVHQAYA